jgi:hypothetical protein
MENKGKIGIIESSLMSWGEKETGNGCGNESQMNQAEKENKKRRNAFSRSRKHSTHL